MGTNELLYIGPNIALTRSPTNLTEKVDVRQWAGREGQLIFKLVSRGVTNVVLTIDSITLSGSGSIANDYDGDGKSDLAFYRDGYWSIYTWASGMILNNAGPWGGKDCIPVPGDYDGDGKSDLAFYRDGYWSIYTWANGMILNNAGPWGGKDCIPVK
jgi:hypothetical protein